MRLLRLFLIIQFSITFGCTLSYAGPKIANIEGTIENNGEVIIQGTDFGTKSKAQPYLYEDWENGGWQVGDSLNKTGVWDVDSDNPPDLKPKISDEKKRHPYSKKSAKFHLVSLQDTAIADNLKFEGKKIFIDMWVWYEMPEQHGDPTHQLKLWKLNSGPGPRGVRPTLNNYHWRKKDGSRPCYIPIHNSKGVVSVKYFRPPANKSWVHYQLQLETNDIGQSNGSYKYWTNGAPRIDISNLAIRAQGDNHFNSVWLGKYLGNTEGDPHTVLYYDEVYIDDSWARVEIGDNSSYDKCTIRETQIPLSWSNTQIKFKPKTGMFKSSQKAYLFIIDSDGDVSAGKEIEIGGTLQSKLVTPPPPTEIQITN